MAVYCELRADEEILEEIGDAKQVLLAACPICPNMSCAVHREDDLPFIKFTLRGIKPLCIGDEMRRMSRLLTAKGASVDLSLPSPPKGLCALEERERKKLSGRGQGSDVVLTFCCEMGKKNVESMMPDTQVLGAMNAKGLLRAVTRRKRAGVFVDRQTVDILRFRFE
jgi:hypothetical protein